MYEVERKRVKKSFHIYKKILEFDNLIFNLICKYQCKIAHAYEHSDSVDNLALTHNSQNKYETVKQILRLNNQSKNKIIEQWQCEITHAH